MIRGGGSLTRISNNVGPQIPVISDNVPDLTARDVHVSGVEAVRTLETVAPVSGAVPIHTRRWSLDSEDSEDDVLSVGALIPLDRLAVCCAQLDGVHDCVPDMLLPEQDSDVEWTELSQDVLPDVFPVVSAEVAAVPWPVPAVDVYVSQAILNREAAPLVVPLIEEMLICVMSGREIEVGLLPDVFSVVSARWLLCRGPYQQLMYMYPRLSLRGRPLRWYVCTRHVRTGHGSWIDGLTRDIQVVAVMFPVIIDETSAVPMPLYVVVETTTR